VAIIAAVAKNGVIGANGKTPWALPADLAHFRSITVGHSIIMGRKTFESLGRPLSHRENIVVSRTMTSIQDVRVVPSFVQAVETASLPGAMFAIGGSRIYFEAIPLASIAYLTELRSSFEGDVSFPGLNTAEWSEEVRIGNIDNHSGLEFDFVTYRRSRGL
jgi:dihydrofolate reductase